MLKNHIDIRLNHERFIKNVCETLVVYSLENEEGYATSASNELEDESGDPVAIICFWSESTRAKICIKEGWSDYQIVEINLSEFMENWCIGIDNDGFLIGTNFDQNMFGFEIEGYDLILELIDELQINNRDFSFQKFEDLEDMKTQVLNALG